MKLLFSISHRRCNKEKVTTLVNVGQGVLSLLFVVIGVVELYYDCLLQFNPIKSNNIDTPMV